MHGERGGPNEPERCCKVIVTSFIPRSTRDKTRMIGNPVGYFDHAQKFKNEEAVLDLVRLNLEIERQVDPGIPLDTILVNNDSGWEPGARFLAGLDGTKTRRGIFRILQRENFGRSFGGYHAAFEAFGEQYDFWLFTEDDILVNSPGYCLRMIDRFNSAPRPGFVAAQGLSTAGLNKASNLLHAHGGVGLSHRSVLEKVRETYGSLPHCGRDDPQDHSSQVRRGEIRFTHIIHELGYELIEPPPGDPVYEYAYDAMRGLATRGGYVGRPRAMLYQLDRFSRRIRKKLFS